MKTKRLPVGTSDFREIRKENTYYIDKTTFIKNIINDSAKILLFPRPRRFGKTLNLSTLRYFFEKNDENTAPLFDNLAIRNTQEFDLHQGKYPVIYLTFKDMKALNWENLEQKIMGLLWEEFLEKDYLLSSNELSSPEKFFFESILEKKASLAECENTLLFLSRCLSRFHKQPAVILIDEYDTPIHAGYTKGYYEEIISFMRGFLSAGLKDNTYLYKGVLTGILRVAKESVFSGLNNLGVFTLLDQEYNTYFGFTDKEVRTLLNDYEIAEFYDKVSYWYNGYNFGGEIIYNPWSVLNFTAGKSREPRPFWVNTASTDIIDKLATRGGREVLEEIGILLENGLIEKPVYESIVMKDLDIRDDLLWSFLLFSGYLKYTGDKIQRKNYELKIPNEEVKIIYEEMVVRWFAEKVESNKVEDMLKALETGDITLFEIMLKKVVLQVMSYHDLSGEPEKVYHALVLGMLVWLSGKYEIRSNRESGYGRYDIMLKPLDIKKHGIIIEFKQVNEKENPEKILESALKQIEEKAYAVELKASGIKDILKIAVVFRGKELWVKNI
ncbi:AAA ATPase-like domain-containing protein [Desulfonema limicola]|uniref:AAA ATPase-like domain-containing protein n=1 Tax=Desulfonema limicola TaxID=45656 RepID=A0A975GIZ7_9BACT|nr:AAA family ATPase [Desulfonema limicola]QTA83100.1 AAA ATPase-like domain-containing protein [Desulfonema limicola]